MNKKITALMAWVDERFPLIKKTYQEHASEYYVPKNFNFWYFFGSFALLVFVIQILSGIFLTMHYKPDGNLAFASVEYIMRDVPWGWVIRYMHSTGASFFFIVIYLHMFRGLLYGSYKGRRELVWLFGMAIYMLLMAEAFMGYLLPWGQMSYWGAQVIINLVGALPVVGEPLTQWVRGDYVVSDATLNRFFALHVIGLPVLLLGLVIIHITALHEVGSNNPDGVEIKKNKGPDGHPIDGIPFHPYYTIKDSFGAGVFLIFFCAVLFFWPEGGGYFIEAANFEPANPLKTPEHIAPVWYFTPYYAILRAIPDKVLGVIFMNVAILMFFILPWLDRAKVKSIRYRGIMFKSALTIFVISFLCLGYLGTVPATETATNFSRLFTVLYFAFFLLMPIYSKLDKTKPVPERVTFK
jgi:ubiquinol-cytochrome c reductase cytochrome b subunit